MTQPSRSLSDLAAAGEYVVLEEQWLELCESAPHDATSFVDAAKTLSDKGERERATVLLSLILPHYESGDQPDARQALLEIAAECAPDDLSLRRQLIEAIIKRYPDSKGIEAFIRAAGVERSPNPSQAVEQVRSLLAFDVGRHVYHAASWGAGRVVHIATSTGNITVDFERRRGHTMPVTGAAALLTPLDDDDFRALCLSQNAELKRLAEEDVPTLFASLLKSRGGHATTKQVKADLLDKVMPAGSWSKWWSAARRALRDAPLIAMTPGSSPDFTLREAPLTPQEALGQRFRAAKRVQTKFDIVRECIERFQAIEDATEFLDEMTADLWTHAQRLSDSKPSRALELRMLVENLRRRMGREDMPDGTRPQDVIAASEDVVALLRDMTADDLRRQALEVVRELRPDGWAETWACMLSVPSPSTCDHVVRELEKAGHLATLQAALGRLLETARDFPDSAIWLWKRAAADKLPVAFDAMAKAGILERLLRLLHDVGGSEGTDRDPGLVAKLRGCLSANNFDAVEHVADPLPADEIRRLHDLVRFNRGLSENGRRTILHILESAAPEEYRKQLKPWEEDAVYATEAGLERQRQELIRLTTVEYLKITKAIGEAAAMGDISDNAEYQSAIEARGQLTQRAAELKAQIDKAKLISRHMVAHDHIGIGAMVEVKDLADGTTRTFALLGPWDADPDADKLSYRAPFSQAFLGKSVGDEVEVETGGRVTRYEVVRIGSAV